MEDVWEDNMSFEANNDFVYNLFSRRLYHIPRNQRKYVWQKQNWEDLYEDVQFVTNIKDGNEHPHFLGSIVLKSEGRERGLQNFIIIDGQQRVITLTIFLACISFWLKYYDMVEDFEGTKQYIVAKDDKANDTIMVTSEFHKSLENTIHAILELDIDKSKTTSPIGLVDSSVLNRTRDGSIASAFKYYITRIKNSTDSVNDPQDYLVRMRDAIVGISYVSIISSTEEDSYTIFEILNARGLALEDHELLKNYIMRYIYPEERRDYAKEIWTEIETLLGVHIKKFIHHYAIHKYGYFKDESDYNIIQRNNKANQTTDLLNDLKIKAEYYVKFINPRTGDENGNCSDIEYLVFSFFKKKRQEQMRSVLLSLIHCRVKDEISEENYNSILIFIYNFYICYKIIGEENSNKISNTVYKYAKKLENEYSFDLVKSFTDELRGKLPEEVTFLNAFNNVGWSHHGGFYDGEKNKDRVQTILEVFERHLSGSCPEDLTIEHVFQDSESAENGKIGNLLPLESRLNKQCQGKDFAEKLAIYGRSNFKTTRNFSERYSKQDYKIDSRTDALGKKMYREVLKFNPV